LRLIFEQSADGPGLIFVEAEDDNGNSISLPWTKDGDYWLLVNPASPVEPTE